VNVFFSSYFVKYHTIYLLKLNCIKSVSTCQTVNDKPFRHIPTWETLDRNILPCYSHQDTIPPK